MSEQKRIVLQPEYVKNFVCDGNICEDNCCKGTWGIHVDEKHYKKIKSVQNKDLKDRIQKYIRRNRNNPIKACYGRLHQDKGSQQCVFLTEDNLCEIQMKIGADYLGDVCMAYPRYSNLIDGKYERSLTMSCPLAAKSALFNPEPMNFEQFEEPIESRIVLTGDRFDTEGHLFYNKPPRYFWDIRIFSLSLLQNRDYALDERLIILGIVYKNIERLHEESNVKGIPELLNNFELMIENRDFKEELEKIPTDTQIQMRLAKELIDNRAIRKVKSDRYYECLVEMIHGIGYIEGETLENVHEKYLNNYNEYYAPYIKEKEYVLENYLVNEYFRERMPFGEFKSIWDSYMFLVMIYSMIKLYLIGIGGYHKELNDELVLKIMQSFSKVTLHNKDFIQHIIQLLKDSGLNSLAYMSILVKN